ncbi:MAG TPA: zinc metalloprotease [Lacibacter sp.]|nr:zinc metalloprotease [Lacibacter sp.]HMO88730.1 zinc metalloprotease [Lacibacter sp.]HMP86460.1 zinc metalloprotease [Lacibacter sp.]
MKKISILSAFALLLLLGCNKAVKTDTATDSDDAVSENVELSSRHCASYEVLQEQLQADPSLRGRMNAIEEYTRKYMENPSAYRLVGDVLEIPVHVNVLYRSSAENVSNAQIQSQIDVLNEDFGATNTDYNNTPSIFQGVRSGDIKIRFVWTTANVTRRSTNKTSWRTNDDMKKSNKGGINPTSPSTTLNIWVCVLSNNILGYAQFPGGSLATDGVVVHTNAFGRGNYTLFSAFNRGRTATHEVGHYFNLRHIWGDATCGNDFVGDTPLHNASNGGCPTYPHYSTCTGTPIEMTMNYMDYTNDACMYMFTAGQAARMQATYAVGGPRASLR